MVLSGSVETDAVVANLEAQCTVAAEVDRDRRSTRVLLRVLERLEAREIDGRFDLLGITGNPAYMHLSSDAAAAGGVPERLGEAMVDEQRRVDAARKRANLVERRAGVGADPPEQGSGLLRIACGPFSTALGCDLQRDQALVSAAVKVA